MRKIAFLVGNDTFPKDPSIPPLRFTQNDALELAAVLGDPETCAFETRLYLNRPSQEVLTDLDQISGELGQDDTLLFYYSGHGKLRGNELCLVSNETTTASLGATSIRTRLVLEYLQGSLARRRILILDCCHSGAIGRNYKAVDSKSTLDGLADSFGSYILTASTSIELAEEREKDGHGVFTKALIDCLREGPKERITINDLYDYAHSRLKISAKQTPLFWALQQEGTAVEIGNYQAKHERELQQERARLERERQLERERLERERQLEQKRLIATARTRLGAYVVLRELTGEQAEEAVALLKRDEARLFPRDRRYRDDLIRFSKGEASFLEVFGAGLSLRPEPASKPPEPEVSLPITPTEAPGVEPSLSPSEPAAAEEPVSLAEPPVVDQFVMPPVEQADAVHVVASNEAGKTATSGTPHVRLRGAPAGAILLLLAVGLWFFWTNQTSRQPPSELPYKPTTSNAPPPEPTGQGASTEDEAAKRTEAERQRLTAMKAEEERGRAELEAQPKPQPPDPRLQSLPVRLSANNMLQLSNFDATRSAAIAKALAGATPGDRDDLEKALAGDPQPISESDLKGEWRCRSLQIHDLGLFIYDFFKCRIFMAQGKLVFQKTSGSQRTRGELFRLTSNRFVYAGAWTVNDDPIRLYGADPKADEVAILVKVSRNRLRLEFPRDGQNFETFELVR